MNEELEIVLGHKALGALIGTALALLLVTLRPGADPWTVAPGEGVLFALVTAGFVALGVLP